MSNLGKNLVRVKGSSGFSMIDVLVSIIVLATAMLALAALQGALTRNSADSRARSQIAAFSDGALDQLRANNNYGNIGVSGSTTINSGTNCTSLGTELKAICQARSTAETAAGVSNLAITLTTQQYAPTSSTNSAFTTNNTAGLSTNGGAYKQVTSTTTWTDATGTSRTMSVDTIISPTLNDTTNSTLVTSKAPPKTSTTAPIVRQFNPAATAGVIPIAVGSTNTAATNPKPEIMGGKNSSGSVGTHFNVLTYQTPENNQALIQKSVDTKIVQCSCKFTANGGVVSSDSNLSTVFAQPYHPTYWDGTHYVNPTATASATSTTGLDSSVTTQDNDCDICCRDRNDVGAQSGDVLFDPFSGSNYLHQYQYDSTGTLVLATSTFVNACRLIRVDGIYTTATDIHNYFLNLVGTDSGKDTGVPTSQASNTNPATSPIPADTTLSSFAYVTNYQNFIKAYLGDSISGFKAGTGPADPSSSPLSTTAPTATGDYVTNSPIDPSNIDITYSSSTPDYRYLHARGLYIDHLEQPAIDAINNAYTNCPTGSTKADCVLPFVPFTTINVTELTSWSPTAGSTAIAVSNSPIVSDTSDYFQNPLKGIVNVTSSSVQNNTQVDAIASMGLSNSSLTGVSTHAAINPYDAANSISDQQQFTVKGGNSGGGGGNGTALYFDVSLTNLTWMNTDSTPTDYPGVTWKGTVLQIGTAASGSATLDTCTIPGTNTNTYVLTSAQSKVHGNTVCTDTPMTVSTSATGTPPAGVTVTVQGYNNQVSTTQTVSCTDGTGSYAVTAYQCYNYAVDKNNIYVVHNGTSTQDTAATTLVTANAGKKAETTDVTLSATPGLSSTTSSTPDLIKIAFGSGTIAQTLVGTCSNCVTKTTGHTTTTTCNTTPPVSQCP